MIPFDRVVVVGLGLVGGSWAKALRRGGWAGPICGVDPRVSPDDVSDGVLDRFVRRDLQASDLCAGDLVVLAAPVDVVLALATTVGPHVPPDVVITDTGSVKRAVCEAWAAHLPHTGGRFVGGHPMAGSHLAGYAASRPDLFDDVAYYLATSRRLPAEEASRDRVAGAVRSIGARPVIVETGLHDHDLAVTSHLPQVVAWALDAVVRDAAPTLPGGSGLADMTRLAASQPDLWSGVLRENADELVPVLARLLDRLAAVRSSLGAMISTP